MGKHYVPRFYLDGFGTNGRLWAHDKIAGQSFVTQSKSVANESDAYPDDLEQYLANEIEDKAKEAIEKIRQLRPLSVSDRKAMADYIVTLWKRVPAGRQRAMEHMPAVGSSVKSEILSALDKMEAEDPASAHLIDQRRRQVEEIIESHCSGSRHDIWHQTLRLEMTPRIGDALNSMHWRYLHAPNGMFLASDNPVFFFAHEGIGSPSSELTLPLSSSVALLINRRSEPNWSTIRLFPSAIKEINRRAVFNANRFVFSEKNEPWILPLLQKKLIALNRLV